MEARRVKRLSALFFFTAFEKSFRYNRHVMPKTYNISLSIRDVGKLKGNLFVVSHADLPEGNRSTLALNYSSLLHLLDFIKVRPAELERIRGELWTKNEAVVTDVQVGPSEFGDVQWGPYFEVLHECSKSFALGSAARRAREAKQRYAISET